MSPPVSSHRSEVPQSDSPPGIYAKTDMGWPPECGLWTYRILQEPLLSSTLERMAQADTHVNGQIHSVSFQPCLSEEESNQDRRLAGQWLMPDGIWTYAAVLDGHAGHATVDFVHDSLSNMLSDAIRKCFPLNDKDSILAVSPPPERVSLVLAQVMSALDKSIEDEFMSIFPGGREQIARMTVREIRQLISQHNDNGTNHTRVMRCICGTTVIAAVMDSSRRNLWVVNLGDSQAIICKMGESGKLTGERPSQAHNASNPLEAARVKEEHPGEPECIINERVLGAIHVTRAIGDFLFKLPSSLTQSVLLHAESGFRSLSRVRGLLSRSLSPPYLSSSPEVHHQTLAQSDKYLILTSDGLFELLDHSSSDPPDKWLSNIFANQSTERNLAMRILRSALGGSNEEMVSRYITVEMNHRWMDDTTILVWDLQARG